MHFLNIVSDNPDPNSTRVWKKGNIAKSFTHLHINTLNEILWKSVHCLANQIFLDLQTCMQMIQFGAHTIDHPPLGSSGAVRCRRPLLNNSLASRLTAATYFWVLSWSRVGGPSKSCQRARALKHRVASSEILPERWWFICASLHNMKRGASPLFPLSPRPAMSPVSRLLSRVDIAVPPLHCRVATAATESYREAKCSIEQ